MTWPWPAISHWSLICGQYVLQEAPYEMDGFLPKSEEGGNGPKVVGLFVIVNFLE